MKNHHYARTALANRVSQVAIRVSASCGLWLAAGLLLPFSTANAEQLKEARVSEIVHDVKLLPQQAPARPAVLSDQVKDGTAVRTGVDSRAELTFTDQTMARLGSNTIFSFNEGTRNLQLGGGAMLLRVPKDAGGAQISTAAITAAITGTTVMLEYHPNAYSKFIVLEGTGRIFRGDRVGESVLVNAGQMMIVNPASKSLPNPVDVDIKRLIKTSSLVKKFKPLASNKLIDHEIGTQTKLKEKGGLIETNLVIFGSGTAVTLLDPTTTSVLDQANANELRATPTPTATPTITPTPTMTPTPPPTPTPSKTGAPSVIASSTPYEIRSDTVINTDPTITTNGHTDFGTIYRSAEEDGSLSKWLFGSTSDFDQRVGLDDLNGLDFAPLAAFKFSSLNLAGNPRIVIGHGDPTSLALISFGDMTSGIPGGPLTFDGLNFLLLATQNGSITLGSNISFNNIPTLAIYARGAGSNLTLDSPFFGTTDLTLAAENDILATNSLTLNASNISIFAGRNLSVGGVALFNILNANGGSIAGDGTIQMDLGTGAFLATSDVAIRLHNEVGGSIGGNGSIGGTIGQLTAGSSFDAAILNQGGSFGGGASINYAFEDTVSVTGQASFRIQNENNGNGFGGGMIGGDAFLNVFSFNFNAGSLSTQINNLGGIIGGESSIFFTAQLGFDIVHDALFQILHDAPEGEGGTNSTITINVPSGSISVGGSLIARISDLNTSFDFDRVTVGASGDITVGNQLLVDGTVTAGGNISATNGIIVAGNLISGGTITSDAGSIAAQSILAGSVIAGEGITINNQAGNSGFGLTANTINALGNLNMINTGLITPNGGTSDDTIGMTPFDFNLSATRIISTGPVFPTLVSNGGAADILGNNNPGNGGTINLALAGLTIGSSNDLASITANGGAFNADSTLGGNGGTINIVSSGDVSLRDGNITATSGELPAGSTATLGSGGTVNITTSGALTVNSKIEVSSASTTAPIRRSAKGGNVNLTSNKTTAGTAISIGNTGQLLALLDAAAPGPGGKITILATGNGGSNVNVNGTVTASKGTVDIRHTGANGTVNISDASGLNNALLSGDVVKVGALGSNGVLTVGRGTLSANDTLKLYGASADGEVRFVDNVTIGGQNFTIIAADTVTILDGKVVTVNGARADVYTGFNGTVPKANYRGFGGNNSTTGTFAGAGANNPQPIANAPPFDGTPGG
jgi:mannose-6-phosphate isomerase-like protein (cupin superfamily)